MDINAFVKEEMVVDAVLRNLEVMGEAASNMPEDVRKRYPEIPWRRIVGLRNIVIHAYFGVDLENIWKIIKENLPEVRPKIEKLLDDLRE